MAAVLACGDAAVVSHRSAALLWGLLPRSSANGPIEVSLLSGYRNPAPSILVHRRRSLAPSETTVKDRIPVTVPVRTLLDLASATGGREVEQAVAQADRMGLVRRGRLEEAVNGWAHCAGVPLLRALLQRSAGPALTRSEAEDRFLRLVRKARLAEPDTNVRIAKAEVDFLWRDARLVVEVDGFAYHSSPDAFERDRRRDAILTAAGYRVLRTTWRQIVDEPEAVIARVAQALVR